MDGQTFEAIEGYGVARWVGELAQIRSDKTYHPAPIRRVYIPKPTGKQRPLGIATLRDRVAQTAAMLVMEPIFEADLLPEQYGYRPQRSALDAVRQVHQWLNRGPIDVIDADLSGYFDAIPQADLRRSIARRLSDRAMLRLIKPWLEAPVEAAREDGRAHRSTPNKESRRGIPQGSPVSPLLSNGYRRRFVLGWKTLGYERRFQARIVNYADDYVICCKGGCGESAMTAMRAMMAKLKLPVHEEKTRLCRVPQESVEFLGYRIGRCYSAQTGQPYIGTQPAKRRVQRLCRAISEQTGRRWLWLDADTQIQQLNRRLEGWANYFCLGPVSKAYQAVDAHARVRLRRWLCNKHKQSGKGTARYPDERLDNLGLVRLAQRTHNFPWANA